MKNFFDNEGRNWLSTVIQEHSGTSKDILDVLSVLFAQSMGDGYNICSRQVTEDVPSNFNRKDIKGNTPNFLCS